jgi:uncharacterized membrane protein
VTDGRLERAMSVVLLLGVAASALLVGVGFGTSFMVGWDGSLLGATPGHATTTDFSELARRLGQLQPLAITQAGLLALIVTPVVRVFVSIFGFLVERDWLYVCLTLVVFGMLVLSLAVLR